jgi:hypothetical protein
VQYSSRAVQQLQLVGTHPKDALQACFKAQVKALQVNQALPLTQLCHLIILYQEPVHLRGGRQQHTVAK